MLGDALERGHEGGATLHLDFLVGQEANLAMLPPELPSFGQEEDERGQRDRRPLFENVAVEVKPMLLTGDLSNSWVDAYLERMRVPAEGARYCTALQPRSIERVGR